MCNSAQIAVAMLAVVSLPLRAGAAPIALNAQVIGRAVVTQNVPFVVHLPLRNQPDLERLVELQGTPGTQVYHHWLSPVQFRTEYGATPAQLTLALMTLRDAGITIDRTSSQFITAHASVAVVERTFGAQMASYRGAGGQVRLGSRVAITLPPPLRRLNADVEGVEYHGEARPMLRMAPERAGNALNRYGLFGALWFDDFKQAYHYPAYQIANGSGVRVATVNEADFSTVDLSTYLEHERIGSRAGDLAPSPSVSHVFVPGAPAFDANNSNSAEADLDTQQVAGIAPGAALAGWTTNAFDFPVDFLQVYDYINEANSADIVSTSYGGCELLFGAGILNALHAAFLQGNAEGITYIVSSGDSAGRECPEPAYFAQLGSGKTYTTIPSVSMPASDPNVVAVGGGNLITSSDPARSSDLNAGYFAENAYADPEPPADPYFRGSTVKNLWWGAGGGQSAVFPKPRWQQGITPGSTRSVPDIGMFVGGCLAGQLDFVQPCADDVTHARLIFDGSAYSVIGTSVAAPQAAGLFATVEDYEGSRRRPGAGRLGNVNPLLYRSPASYFHKDIPGYNGVVSFSGGQRWNPSYGLGSLFNISPFRGSAGTPQTATNP